MIYMTNFAFSFLLCSLYLLNGVVSYSLRYSHKINYPKSIRMAVKSVLPPIDEIVDISEIFHDPLIAYHLDGLFMIYLNIIFALYLFVSRCQLYLESQNVLILKDF